MAPALPGAHPRMAPQQQQQQQQPRPSARARASARPSSAPAAWFDASPLALEHGPVVAERRLGGSQWAAQLVLETSGGSRFFAKTAAGDDAAAAEMFRGEMLGLNALRDASDASGAGLAVPRVLYGGAGPGGGGGGGAFIVMEHLDLQAAGGGAGRGGATGKGVPSLQARLGEAMARLHGAPVPVPGKFGFSVDNTIGGTPQRNGWMADWVAFYRDRRLLPQLRLAADPALTAAAGPVLDNLGLMFNDYAPGGGLEGRLAPSLLHGDLWSGNYGAAAAAGKGGADGGGAAEGGSARPCVFDPAAYQGHSEAEHGMSWCGGFTGEYWAAYLAARPAAPGFAARRPLYELYHYLNHLNLFGGRGYRGNCLLCLESLAAVVRAGGVPAR